MTAFDETLSSFCEDVLGLALDAKSIIILESSTPEKFSKHVVVHRLLDKEKDTMVPLAFANNAQAGLFVNELMNYARTNREGSSARHLFVQAPKSSEADGRETTLIDESVYSRNRSFRLLFQSKFAKNRRLELNPCEFGVQARQSYAIPRAKFKSFSRILSSTTWCELGTTFEQKRSKGRFLPHLYNPVSRWTGGF